MAKQEGTDRRAFLRQAIVTAGVATQARAQSTNAETEAHAPERPRTKSASIEYPRVFEGRQLKMIAFPLGGVAAGSISLGGRGQLRDWEIFNRANKGYVPPYAFPVIWARAGKKKPVSRVLEGRIEPPFVGEQGLGSDNVPGLPRLKSARFTGEYPLARIDFEDRALPVHVSLEAFSPFIPHDADDSGLPVAILRYRVKNPNTAEATVSIGFAIENPILAADDEKSGDTRQAEYREEGGLAGLVMANPGLPAEHPMRGEFIISANNPEGAGATVMQWRGWPRSKWWNSPMLFWDDFSDDGRLGTEPDPRNAVGSLCVQKTIASGHSADFTFLIAWRFPNRIPAWGQWDAPEGDEKTVIGNHYAVRFATAWDAASYASTNLPRLEAKTRLFASALRDSTLPTSVKDAASANLSTLATTVCFRTADGEFHGFEGSGDKHGLGFGTCTHVWNYETSTAHVFPELARSLRKASFGYCMDDAGAMHFRQVLPENKKRFGYAAADGQMGQILHAYLDWKLSGDDEWLKNIWPRVKKGIEFAWVRGGWDADKDGVLEGVQHNTYDVEFYGPNPLCGVYYLAALRAVEEMAHSMGDSAATEYRRLFESGRAWIDAKLFNGEFYIQKVRGYRPDEIAPNVRGPMGSDDTEHPEYQAGEGCLADQLLGQYLADVAGLGDLLDEHHMRQALQSIFRYNYRESLADHDSVQRTYALNDEAALLICDYGRAQRPHIPFPYYAEAWTGVEYSTASLMMFRGMTKEGVQIFDNVRARFDGERRNPWDEPEYGHHYSRAMAAWSGVLALSGFRYQGASETVTATPRIGENFHCFWSSGTGWGTFTLSASDFRLKVLHGKLPVRSFEIPRQAGNGESLLNGKAIDHTVAHRGTLTSVQLSTPQVLVENDELSFASRG